MHWSSSLCSSTGLEVYKREVNLPSFVTATELVRDVSDVAEAIGHHPSVSINPRRECEDETNNCTVVIETTSFTAKGLTKADEYAAVEIEAMLHARWAAEAGIGLESQVDYANERIKDGKPFYEPTWMKHTRKAGGVWNQ